MLVSACGGGDDDTSPAASSSATSTSGAGGGGGTSGAGGSGGVADKAPDPAVLPIVTSTCPELVSGKQTFSPDGNAREVEIWAGDGPQNGPLVFFWHGAGGSPTEATYALGSATIQAIKDMGGIVAAAYHDPAAGQLPWFLSIGGSRQDDLRVADEVLACAMAKGAVDVRRIHSVGFSAGAMNTMQFSYFRSSYLASIVTYSGSLLGNPEQQDASNKYPAMLFHGGPSDQVIINFEDGTVAFRDKMKEAGHFAFICDHGKGHTVPSTALPSAWQFLQDHPFGTDPSPYVAGLPEGFPSYCAL